MYTGTLAATSNRTKWDFDVELRYPDTLQLLDFAGATIEVAIRPAGQTHALLFGSNANGKITVTGLGTFRGTFPRSDMTQLIPNEYDIGLRVVLANGDEFQVLAAQLPVVDGVLDA